MKYFFRTISGMGCITWFLGMSAMDSNRVTLAIVMVFAGLGAYFLGTKLEDDYG